MSMVWMRMPGQTWPGAAASFIGMWTPMMAAMMMPSLVPAIRRFRGRQAAIVGAGYALVWVLVGLAVFWLGAALGAIEMQRPALAGAVPIAAGAIVVSAGVLQFTSWKARHLACCRTAPAPQVALATDAATAWRYGLRLGFHCTCAGMGLTAILLVLGFMDLSAMAAVTVAITLERLAPAAERVARGVGAVVIGGGLLLLARAAGLG